MPCAIQKLKKRQESDSAQCEYRLACQLKANVNDGKEDRPKDEVRSAECVDGGGSGFLSGCVSLDRDDLKANRPPASPNTAETRYPRHRKPCHQRPRLSQVRCRFIAQ
jgi:hypothetical protein